jgi:hypothetical protein
MRCVFRTLLFIAIVGDISVNANTDKKTCRKTVFRTLNG